MAFKLRALAHYIMAGGKNCGLTAGPCVGTAPPCTQTHYPVQPGCLGGITLPGCAMTNTPWVCTPTHGTTGWTPVWTPGVWCTPTHGTTTTPWGAAAEVASMEALSTLKEQLQQQLAMVESEEKKVMDELLPTTVEACEDLIKQLQEALREVEDHLKVLSAKEKPSDPK